MLEQKFGDRLKETRLNKHMSQDDLATLLGTSKQVISRYETNQRTPKITVANKYAEILQVPLNYLLGDTEAEKQKPSEMESLKKDEKLLLKAFRQMTADQKDMLLRLAAVKSSEIDEANKK